MGMGNRLEKPSLSERGSNDNFFPPTAGGLRRHDAFVSTGDLLPAPGAERIQGSPAPKRRLNYSKITRLVDR
jgi:hypothetical protein